MSRRDEVEKESAAIERLNKLRQPARADDYERLARTLADEVDAITAERDEWKRRCEEIAKMLGDEHTLLSGHEGTDDWYCTTSRTWFPITDLSVEEGEPPQCPFSCACSNVFIAPELEITIDTLARLLAIAEGRDNG